MGLAFIYFWPRSLLEAPKWVKDPGNGLKSIRGSWRDHFGGIYISPQQSTSMPWLGAQKYCQFSGKTENWYTSSGAQSKTQVALARCSISVKELSIMHLITDYLRAHSDPPSLHIESETQEEKY